VKIKREFKERRGMGRQKKRVKVSEMKSDEDK
jgi:hypothetical protein